MPPISDTSTRNNEAKYNQLIGTEVSLYSGKARGYLRYKKIPFKQTLSTFNTYRKTVIPRVGKRIIPVIITPDDQCIQDTTCIIDHFEQLYPEHSVYPTGNTQKSVALLLETFGDEWLVMPAMHYRWHFKRDNLKFILKEFGQTAVPSWPKPLQYLIGSIPALAFGNLYKPYFGIYKHLEPAIEKSYLALMQELDKHFSLHPYLLGERPCVGDFGLLGPLYAHLYRDPYPGKLMKQQAPHLAKWVERMQFLDGACYGDFLANDEIPETLLPILKRMGREQIPVLENTAKALDQWHIDNPEQIKLPRTLGRTKFSIEGVESTRSIVSFSYWMFQRALDHYQQVKQSGDVREVKTLEELYQQMGALQAFQKPANTRLEYKNYRLQIVK